MKRVFIIEKRFVHVDSWTGGDYRQYVCSVDDDTVVIARASLAPTIWAALGFAYLLIQLLVVFNVPYQAIDWVVMGICCLTGFVLLGPAVIEWKGPWRWMVQLHPPIKRNADGRFMRTYLDA